MSESCDGCKEADANGMCFADECDAYGREVDLAIHEEEG